MGGTIIPGMAVGWREERHEFGVGGSQQKKLLTQPNIFIIIKKSPCKYINMCSPIRTAVTEATL